MKDNEILVGNFDKESPSAIWDLEHVESYRFHIKNRETSTYLQRRPPAEPTGGSAGLVHDALPEDAKAAMWIFREAQ